jgi:hypothetical protein
VSARILAYAGRVEESLAAAAEALRLAERTEDRRLQGALRLRLADGAERLGRSAVAAAHRAAAEHLLVRPRPRPDEQGAAEGSTEGSAGRSTEGNSCET